MQDSTAPTTPARTAPNAPAEGAVCPPAIPGYAVGRLLGRGGTAEVWLVTGALTGQTFAAKVMRGAGRAELAVLLRRELQLMSRFQHEHLVRAHEVLAHEDNTVLLMDLAAGGSLAELVAARGPLPVAEVVTIITPIARCLAYLHANGMTHSDLAPGNVLFTEYGKPLLSDLGLSRVTGESGAALAGTAGFADPYQDSGPGWDDAAQFDAARQDGHQRVQGLAPGSDIYALGALTWFALTGRVPASTAQRPPLSMLVPDVPDELLLLIEAALQPEAEARPSAAEYERVVYRSETAGPVDLLPAAHESVLPLLLTRRDLREGRKRRRGFMRRPPRNSPARMMRGRSHTGRSRGGRSRTGRMVRPLMVGVAALLVAASATAVLGGQPALNSHGDRLSRADGTRSAADAAVTTGAQHTPVDADDPGTVTSAREKETLDQARKSAHDVPPLPEALRSGLRSEEPAVAVRALARLRSYAYNSGRFELLHQVNAPGSEAMAVDQSIADQLSAAGQVLDGLRSTVSRAEPLPTQAAGETLISATVSTSGYLQRGDGGEVVHRIGANEQEITLALVQQRGRWLIDRILAPAAES